ncbi:hypothetical protein [Helicobacter pylori]|uniref:hypothetical protein n=1 Tax=Helicobacter pylori TaxID=210 RepID=UPI002877733F|nr:hypothetical protein [Helicobacter pylori]
MKQNEFKKQLVPMNPDNQVNYKLTLNLKELEEITNLIKELEGVFRIRSIFLDRIGWNKMFLGIEFAYLVFKKVQ